jgi:hypothetical protein
MPLMLRCMKQRHILLIIILFFNIMYTHMYDHEPISVLLLLPSHSAKIFLLPIQPARRWQRQHMYVLCVRKVNKIPVLSHNTITSGAENRERISFMMRALLCMYVRLSVEKKKKCSRYPK